MNNMDILVQLSEGQNNPQWPGQTGSGAKVIVEFPFTEEFYEIISEIHGNAFKINVDNKEFSCVLNQGGTPIAMIFPDKEASPPIVSMKLLVYCDLDEILEIKKANKLRLLI
jgi:hypothetical protein